MLAQDRFNDNIERWSVFCKPEAEQLRNLKCSRIFFVDTDSKVLNIYQDVNGNREYFHSLEDPVAEAKSWFEQLEMHGLNVLYVYGVGLGYYYEAAREWLKNENHFLIFLEDDLEVIYRLFETETGSRILFDKQVRLLHFVRFNPMDDVWINTTQLFSEYVHSLSALEYYARKDDGLLPQIHAILSYWTNYHQATTAEYRTFGHHFFTNFFLNLKMLPQSYQAKELFGKFVGVPAIICGAGPSLDKNLSVLEQLGDRALIFAGATAMNAVNSHGFLPHFGTGIDPNSAQLTRLIMNNAFEVPYLYRSRLYPEALRFVHGPKLYVPGAGGYRISNWLEEKLNIPGFSVDEGFNVVNFSLSLAIAMGCNPIILVGLDLSYSETQSYHSGVRSHPTHVRRRDFRTKTMQEDLLIKSDIYGNPVYTVWKWVSESFWYTQVAHTNPNVLFINATEGGIGMMGIPNRPLIEVKEYLLQNKYDFRVWTHGEIQNATMPPTVTEENINQYIAELETSLINCEVYSLAIMVELEKLAISINNGGEIPPDFMNDVARENLEKLKKEVAYTFILEEFVISYPSVNRLKYQQIDIDSSINENEKAARRVLMEAGKYKLLRDAALVNHALMKYFVFEAPETMTYTSSDSQIKVDGTQKGYSFDDQVLSINDPDLNLNVNEPVPEGKSIIKHVVSYTNDAPKVEQHYLDGVLHGPVSFFAEDGQLLARSWYVHGIQQGKAWFYYNSGEVYSIQRFQDGVWNGIQQFYYKNGILKSLLNYSQGQLDGEVSLYYPSGLKKRMLNFSNGKRHGYERLWNEKAALVLEAEFREDVPVGVARTWHPNGQVAQEITFDDTGKTKSIQSWDAIGNLIPEEKSDYFDSVTKQTQMLTKSLEEVFSSLHKVMPILVQSAKKQEDIESQMTALKQQLENLEAMGKHLMEVSGLEGEGGMEDIWKTPTTHRELQKQLKLKTAQLTQAIEGIQTILLKAKDALEKPDNNKDER